ncbi:hypothetical protein SO802_002207 [Lithocarpus litseifolius]|uniref:Uncharacterized protein n=1 Tax=Lithocarpus litseifolius TaxID=425828 RepID=A0AAW2DWW2_9ROSI
MDNIKHLDAFVTDKLTDMEIDNEAKNYMDEDPSVLMLKEEGTCWEMPAITEATTELSNWAWEGAAHPMEDSMKKIKTVKSVTLAKKIKTVKAITPAKNTVYVPIESISGSVSIPVESVYDSIPIKISSPVSAVFIFSWLESRRFPDNQLRPINSTSVEAPTRPIRSTFPVGGGLKF